MGWRVARPALAVAAFLTYAAAVLWLHGVQQSTWRVEQLGPLPVAASYLFYGKPFGSLDGGLWDFIAQHAMSASASEEMPADAFLAAAAERKIPAAGALTTTVDGSGLGMALFATAALSLFGARTLSLLLAFLLLMGTSVLVFVLRFRDDRLLAIPILFFALTAMLFTPQGTERLWIDQSPIGGFRFFVIAGIVPALHVIFELFDATKGATRSPSPLAGEGQGGGSQLAIRASIPPPQPSPAGGGGSTPSLLHAVSISTRFNPSYALLALQFALLLCVTAIRMSSAYFLGAIACAALLALWTRRHDLGGRTAVVKKAAILVLVAVVFQLGGRWLTPAAYRDAGLTSETFWHRSFVGFDQHPGWPFGDLAARFDCRPEIPEGLRSGGVDRNAHCAYFAALKQGATPGPLFGTQYEEALRHAYWQVVRDYPRKALETYLIYKPLLLWNTLAAGTHWSVSRSTAPALIALAAQLIILVILVDMLRRSPPPPAQPQASDAGAGGLPALCGAFALIAAFSLAPQLLAWSSVATSADVICYMYVALALLITAVLRHWPARAAARRAA